ncbi:AAA family ATPase [Variovorax saccharolyticus]|uniref:AAA family ATPase n=1 Tax=Variovorax saccharolyticus TaxID=3053516 RepID=UPI00257669BD|nr:AAA family ATPase [Variovorax sp. J31P216]MDM0025731.1 AAA family ATPase [Variovorax sp. J31P216]
MQAFEAVKGKEVIALQRSLSVEKAAREEIAQFATVIKQNIASIRAELSTEAIRLAIRERTIEAGLDEAKEIIRATEGFDAEVIRILGDLERAHTSLSTSVSAANKRWAAKEAPLRTQIDEKRRILEAQKVNLDLGHITQLSQQEIKLDSNLKKLKSWESIKAAQEDKYRDAIRRRWESRLRVSHLRQHYAIKASKALGEVLTDLNVKLQYGESDYSTDAVDVIVKAMNWRTVNHNKARTLVSSLGVPKLIQALRAKQVDVISLEDDLGLQQFPEVEARHIVVVLSAREVLDALDRCKVDDAPRLTVTKLAARDGQKPKVIQREFAELSLGQQQSVLLALILSSDSKRPLIIDQPEDNLDSEFIFHTFVPVLRRAKERRQVIIVTHNANIAVLGDAEQLVVLKSNAEHSKIVARGSIDDDAARDAACNVLEGAKEAFTRRAKIYGLGR